MAAPGRSDASAAKVVFLGALLGILSYQGASATSGFVIPKGGLEKVGHQTKDPLQQGLEGHLKRLPPFVLREVFLEVSLDVLSLELVGIIPVTGWGLHVSILAELRVRCVTPALLEVFLSVSVKVTVRLKGGSLELGVEDCNAEFGEIRIDVLGLVVPRIAFIDLWTGPVCQGSIEMCKQLNYLLLVNIELLPLPPGCTYTKLPPLITDLAIELPFHPTCPGISKPSPSTSSCSLPLSGLLDISVFLYINADHVTCLLAALLKDKIFDKEMLLTSVTTTTILELFPMINCPKGYPIVVLIACVEIYAEISLNDLHFHFTFRVTVGYEQQGTGFISLLHLDVKGHLSLSSAADCPGRLLLLSVGIFREFLVTGSCEGVPCSIDSSVVEKVFPLKTWCTDIFNAGLKDRLPFLLPMHFTCDACSPLIYLQGCAYFSCNLLFLL